MGLEFLSQEGSQIVVTVKNSEVWIEGFIRSYYRQGMSNFKELLLVDLGSCDDTLAIVERISKIYPGLTVFLLPDISQGQCIVKALEPLVGPTILILDGTKLSYHQLLKSTKSLTSEKNIEIGLKTYEK